MDNEIKEYMKYRTSQRTKKRKSLPAKYEELAERQRWRKGDMTRRNLIKGGRRLLKKTYKVCYYKKQPSKMTYLKGSTHSYDKARYKKEWFQRKFGRRAYIRSV